MYIPLLFMQNSCYHDTSRASTLNPFMSLIAHALDTNPFASVIDGLSVSKSRENMGYKLADRIKKKLTAEQLDEIDAVIPIPETSNTSAACVAARLSKTYSQGFCKNR